MLITFQNSRSYYGFSLVITVKSDLVFIYLVDLRFPRFTAGSGPWNPCYVGNVLLWFGFFKA